MPNHDINETFVRNESDSQIEQLIINNCESVSKKHIANVLSRLVSKKLRITFITIQNTSDVDDHNKFLKKNHE